MRSDPLSLAYRAAYGGAELTLLRGNLWHSLTSTPSMYLYEGGVRRAGHIAGGFGVLTP